MKETIVITSLAGRPRTQKKAAQKKVSSQKSKAKKTGGQALRKSAMKIENELEKKCDLDIVLLSRMEVSRYAQGAEEIDPAVRIFFMEREGDSALLNAQTADLSVLRHVLPSRSPEQRAHIEKVLETRTRAPAIFNQTIVRNLRELYDAFLRLGPQTRPVFEFQIGNRWFPSISRVSYSFHFGGKIWIDAAFRAPGARINEMRRISGSDINIVQHPQGRKIEDILREQGVRLSLQTDEENTRELALCERRLRQNGKLVKITSNVFRLIAHWFGSYFEEVRCGSPLRPVRGVIENDLEIDNDDRRSEAVTPLPFVRVFLLAQKEFVYLHVDDLHDYQFEEGVLNRLVVPEKTGMILREVLTTDIERLFGDVVTGKSGGLIVLASGPTGVGKTLTAEIFAEHTKRPLYTLEIGELGVELDLVEERLKKVFERAIRWNAVVLFDEADIFLTERGDDMERAAIVGVLLRLLDYYPGILFLTTNRADRLDPAVLSRVTVHLRYEKLSLEARKKVWENLLRAAGFESFEIEALGALELNGRQIRSAVRLLKILKKDEKALSSEDIASVPGLLVS